MFDIGWSEILVIIVVAIVVVGPKELPRLMGTFGRYAGKLRRAAAEFQRQFDDAIRDTRNGRGEEGDGGGARRNRLARPAGDAAEGRYAGEPHHAGASDPARARDGAAARRRDSATHGRDEEQAEAAAQACRFDQAEERKAQTDQDACGAAA